MANFPKGWFFIKNQINNYVLSAEKLTAGEPIIISTLRSKDIDYQLWQYGEDQRLHNKKTGFVLDVRTEGPAKSGIDVVQQNESDSSRYQTFGLTSDGHIYLTNAPDLVIGIKESFFTRRDGQHVHLQLLDKNIDDKKEQRWDFVSPSQQRAANVNNPMNSLKRTISGASLGVSASTSSSQHSDEDVSLDEPASHEDNNFTDTEFFIKSDASGLYITVDANAVNSPGARLCLMPLSQTRYGPQLWHYDIITGRLINKYSGFTLSAEELNEDTFVCQSSSMTEKDLPLQSWVLTDEGEVKLKQSNFVLGFKKDSWFNSVREGAPILLQKKSNTQTLPNQRFNVIKPVFKKRTNEIVKVSEGQGAFPSGHFFIKNQRQGLVLTVEDTDKLAAAVVAAPMDLKGYWKQLWSYENGFLVNQASKMVLDVRGGCIVSGSKLCQYKQKKEGSENQQWSLSIEGYIHPNSNENLVLSISDRQMDDYPLFLVNKKTPDHEEQRWNFVVPVIKKQNAPVKAPENTVQKTVCNYRYVQYPSGWFFIRSFASGLTNESPLVLTTDDTNLIKLSAIDKENWRHQLWTYSNGALVNFATQKAIDVHSVKEGEAISQELCQAGFLNQRWNLTVEGYLVHGSNPSLNLVVKPTSKTSSRYDITLSDKILVEQEHRWAVLTPEIKFENGLQVLARWSVARLSEWKNSIGETVQKAIHRIADWPEETFFITGHDGLALVPEKSEAFAFLIVKRLETGPACEHFKWTFRNGYLVHVATGLVLHASDDLVGGSQLQIREELLLDSKTIDQRQKWLVKTDGSIVSEAKNSLGFALIQQEDRYYVQLGYASTSCEHYAWGFARGHFESRYSAIYKKEVSVLSRIERIVLSVQTKKPSSTHSKLVTKTFGVFPENWFYICSKADNSLVLTAPSKDEGAKLILAKRDPKNFRPQLWHVQDDGCLVNLQSNYVIDVAGGAFNPGSHIIQWHEKYLRRYRKNQIWALSVDGHIHPRSRPGLVLGAKDNKAVEGVEIQLLTRGALDLYHQLWSFAIPIFGRTVNGVKGVSAAGVLEDDDSTVFIDNVNETHIETSTTNRYERQTKITVIRRWGLFPEGGFFIRAGYGDEHLSLTVERKARTGENERPEYEVALRPLNFKEYQWHLWFYQDGHLVNAQTGLALDASPTKSVLVEDGLRTPLFVREKSMSEHQFWSLTVNGEIYLRSDEHFVIGASNSRRVSVSGAQVGLRELRVRKFINENGQQETSIKSETWLKWTFAKPIYRSTTSTTTTSTSASVSVSVSESAAGLVTTGEILEGLTDHVLSVKEREESTDDYSDEDSSDDDSISDKSTDVSKDLNLAGNLGIATAGAGIIAGATGIISNVITSAPETITAAITGSSKASTTETVKQSVTKKTSYKSLQYDRKDSFHLEADYVPTGFEKIVRFKTHQKPNFPTSGYFMIKSHLHGFVLDIVNGQPKDGAFVVLAPIKSTDFASQLWSYDNGQIVNLKGYNLVLDASMTDTVTAGERLVVSTKKSVSTSVDQHWEFGTEGGLILLTSRRNFVLGVKQLKRVTTENTTIDVYIQEEKTHLKSNFARPEQRWEIKIPALIPVEQTTNTTEESKYTVIENGKVSCVSSSVSAIIAFEWIKHTFQHKVTVDNQWPSAQNWFFIRIGNENAFLSSGVSDSSEVKVVSLEEKEDHKQFLWVFINGYLINYKYMLRLIYDHDSKKLLLSKDTKTLDQQFSISSNGTFSVKLKSDIFYFNVASGHEHVEGHSYDLNVSKEESLVQEHSLQLHIPVFSDVEVEKESKVALFTVTSWVQSSQKITSISSSTTSTSTTTTTVAQQYGVFPIGTWFFIKALTESGDSFVLAVKDASLKSGASLILKKLSFKDYKSQLWTFRDGLLINYGSKYVIDVNGEINESAHLVQSTEAGVSSQKWVLTASGQIQLNSYSRYTFGRSKTETIKEGLEVVLADSENSSKSSFEFISWRFSVPIFGKATAESSSSTTTTTTTVTTTTTATMSAIERLTASIEAGAIIESVEEADIKVEDISVKKNNAVSKADSSSTTVVAKEKHHDFQDMLTSVGIAVTAGAVAVGAVAGASKIAEKLSDKHEEKKSDKVQVEVKKTESTSTSNTSQQLQNIQGSVTSSKATSIAQETSNTTSAVTDVDKKTETVVVRRSSHTSVQIIEESRVIVRAWKIVFSQRIHRCKSKAELVQTIEESREELYRRLDEHLRVHASVEHLISGAVPEWHVSIQQVKEIFRARIFEKFLDVLKTQEITSSRQLDFDAVLSSSLKEVENHYKLAIETQSKIEAGSITGTTSQATHSYEETSIQESAVVAIDTIKVTVRYWLMALYEAVSVARSKGSSDEEINIIIENSRKQLSSELTKIKTTTSEHLEKSSSTALTSKISSITSSIETAIKHTESIVSSQVSVIRSEKQSSVSEEHWYEVSRVTEEKLSSDLKVYQTAVTQEISGVQKTEISKSDQAEISVVLDEKMVSVAQQTVSNKLIETQTKVSSWFTEVTQQVSWVLEESQTSNTDVLEAKQNALAIVDAAQVELSTRIEEAKLVLRAYYAHLTYLSWAERRRIEYSLENIKASVIANITYFKKSLEKSDITKEQIGRYLTYSFGATSSRIVISDLQSIVVKVTNVKETTTIVNVITEAETEKVKKSTTEQASNAASGSTIIGSKTATQDIEITKSKVDDTVKKADVAKVEIGKPTEVIAQPSKTTDTIESEVEQTKIGVVDKKQSSSTAVIDTQKESSSTVSGHVTTAILGAAAAAMAGAAIIHHHEGKEESKKQENVSESTSKVSTAVIEKPTQSNTVIKSDTKVTQDSTTTSTVTKQEKTETLVVAYDKVQVTVHEWLDTLSKRVYECAQKKSATTQQEIDSIIFESQQQLVTEIEKAKRNTTSVIGTSQTSFHDTLTWIRSTVWKQVAEVKQVGYQVASSTTTSTAEYEQKLEHIKKTTFEQIDTAIQKSKVSASTIHVVGHESAAVIAPGKKFEGVDYSKTTYGETIESTKVTVGIFIEETRVTIQRIFRELTSAITERRKQGGANVQADVDVIIKKHNELITDYIAKSKSEFQQRITTVHDTSSSSEEVSKVQVELTNETTKKFQATLEQIQQSVSVQVTKVQEVNTSTTITSETEYEEKILSISNETCEKLDASLSVSESVIGHHIEVVAESTSSHHKTSSISQSESSKKSDQSTVQVSLGAEYGLLVVSETTKKVSEQIAALIEQVHHSVTVGSATLETDVHGYATVSEKELELVLEQAKHKIAYELSMIETHEKAQEEHFIASLEAIRQSAKVRITQIQTVATTHKEESKVVSEKLLQIAEESRHEVVAHYETVKQTVVKKSEKVNQVVHGSVSHETSGSSQAIIKHDEEHKKLEEQKKQEEHQSNVDLAKKVLIGAAGVAAGTAIAVELAKKIKEHKEKAEIAEHNDKKTAEVIEDVKLQFNKWISSLTETVVSKSKQSSVTAEEISVTIEKSKTEFLQVIKATKSSEVITAKHQQEILSWVEQTAVAQASRIEEIAISSQKMTAIDLESRLEIVKISTSQEVHSALDKCKDFKSTTTAYVGASIEQIKQKEAALLDIHSELTIVIQDVKSSLVGFFQRFTKSVISRLEQGGDNVEKDVAILIANSRKEMSTYIETVRTSATKKLSSLESKSSTLIASTAAFSGVATAELIASIKFSEELLIQKINRVHSSVWYLEKNQDVSKIVESVVAINTETTTEISHKVESVKHGFVSSVNEQHTSGSSITQAASQTKVSETVAVVLEASLSVQEIKITIREWLRRLAEKVSLCSEKGGSSEEIDLIIKKENEAITQYLNHSVTKISANVKSQEHIKYLHSTVEQVKTTISQTTSEIKVIAVEASGSGSYGYGGFDKMTSVITKHEHKISETLVVYETKISTKVQEEKKKQESTSSSTASKTSTTVSKTNLYSVVVVDYVLSTVHTWFEELMVDVSEYAKYEHEYDAVNKKITCIVKEHTSCINIEFDLIIKKIRSSSSNATAKQTLINNIQWASGMVLQIATQIQTIGINNAVSFSSTGGIEQMRPLASNVETQIKVAFGSCDKSLKIEVERISTHYEQKKTKIESRKEECKKKAECIAVEKTKIQKAKHSKYDSESESGSEDECSKKKKQDNDKKSKKDKFKFESKKGSSKEHDSDASSDESGSDTGGRTKKKTSVDKKKVAAGVAAGIIAGKVIKSTLEDSDTDTSSGSETESDFEKDVTYVDASKLVTGKETLNVSIIVRQWYKKLIFDVSSCAKKGGSNASVDIDLIVQKATRSITETLRIISSNAHKSVVDSHSVTQYQASIEWAKQLVIQSSLQIKAIGINSAASSSKTGGIEQMRPVAVAIQEQVDVEIRRYKLVVEKTETTSTTTKVPTITEVQHQKNSEVVSIGHQTVVTRKKYLETLDKHVSTVIAESKVVVVSWLSQLIRDVSICIHQGGKNVEQDVAIILEKSRLELESTIKSTHSKLITSINTYEKDKTFSLIASQIQQSFKTVQTTIDTKLSEVQAVVHTQNSNTVNEKLSAILEASKVQITETFELSQKESATYIHQETVQIESTVTVIETVSTVKSTIINWQSRIAEEVQAIHADVNIKNKEERISALVKEAQSDVERVTAEAKSKVSQQCSSVERISKSKEQELLSTIDFVHETFEIDVQKIQETSVEAIKKSGTNVKESISSLIQSSRNRIDTVLTGATATVVGVATAAIAIHTINKEDKKEEKKSTNELSIDAKDNVKVLSEWFELFTKRVSTTVHKTQGDVIQNVDLEVQHAEQEITEIISTARNNFIKRLSLQNLDQESYNYACKHYEESLESVRVTIVSQIVEVKKVAIESHTTGSVQELESKLTKISQTSSENIKVAMGSSVVISQKPQSSLPTGAQKSESVVKIEVKEDDAIVVGEQEIEFDKKESTVVTKKQEDVIKKTETAEEKKKSSNIENFVKGALAIGAAAGAAVVVHKKNEKEETEKQKKQEIFMAHQKLTYDSGESAIENVNITLSAWFTALVQKVSTASKSGASSQKITIIVDESRTELNQIIEHTKFYGSRYCSSATDEKEFISKIEWAASLAHSQATQIQQIGINASASKTDMSSQMTALVMASYQQIEVTLQQLKTTVKFHEKVNKVSSSKTQVDATKAESSGAVQKPVIMPATIEKTNVAYTVLQKTRVTTVALFVSLSERIITRIRQGGANVQEDINKMIESTEQEVSKILKEAKCTSEQVDKNTTLEIEEALTSVHKSVQKQITELKLVSIQVTSVSTIDTNVAVEKVLEVSNKSKTMIETTFTSVSETITTSQTVEAWFAALTSKVTKVLKASECTEEEKQIQVYTIVAHAQVELKTMIEFQQTTTTTTTISSKKTSEVTA